MQSTGLKSVHFDIVTSCTILVQYWGGVNGEAFWYRFVRHTAVFSLIFLSILAGASMGRVNLLIQVLGMGMCVLVASRNL